MSAPSIPAVITELKTLLHQWAELYPTHRSDPQKIEEASTAVRSAECAIEYARRACQEHPEAGELLEHLAQLAETEKNVARMRNAEAEPASRRLEQYASTVTRIKALAETLTAWMVENEIDPKPLLAFADRLHPEQLDPAWDAIRHAELNSKSITVEKSKPRSRKRITRAEANQSMMNAVEVNPDRMKWSAREWALHVGCSTSTIAKTAMWKQGTKAREKAKLERKPRNNGKRRSRHYSEE
jgi:hypothetical protein